MKTLKTIAPIALAALTLAACSSASKPERKAEPTRTAQAQTKQVRVAQVNNIDGKKEVNYVCGDKGQDKLSVMYGFQGKDVVVAQVKAGQQVSSNLFRVLDEKEDNVFTDGRVTWVAGKADASNVDKVDGNMLFVSGVSVVNGKQERVDQIVTRYCKVEKVAAKSSKTTKKAKAKKS
ncbi:MAG: hypothetical protein Q4E16_00260 [Neisseria sp.]|nr:hypothetical protein [Neisseria sp.]